MEVKVGLDNFDYSLSSALLWGNCRAHYQEFKEKNTISDLVLTALEAIPVIGQGVSLVESGIHHLSTCIDTKALLEIGQIANRRLNQNTVDQPFDVETPNGNVTTNNDANAPNISSLEEAKKLFEETDSLDSVPREYWQPLLNLYRNEVINFLILESRVEAGEIRILIPLSEFAEGMHQKNLERLAKYRFVNRNLDPVKVSKELLKAFDKDNSLKTIPREQWDVLYEYFKQSMVSQAVSNHLVPGGAIPVYMRESMLKYYADMARIIDNAIQKDRNNSQ